MIWSCIRMLELVHTNEKRPFFEDKWPQFILSVLSASIDSEVNAMRNSMNGARIATLKSQTPCRQSATVRFGPNSQFLFVEKMVMVIRNDDDDVDSEEQETKITSVCFDQCNDEYIVVGYH